MAVAGEALVDQVEIGLRRRLEADAVGAQRVDRREDVVGGEREMLDAFALIVLDELFDLRMLVLAFVQRDADLVVGRGHRLAEQAGRLALNVEIADLAEVEDALVIVSPIAHPPALQIVGEVVERVEADAVIVDAGAGGREVGVVDARCCVDQIEVCAANAFDRGDVELAGAVVAGDLSRAAVEREFYRVRAVRNAERHRIGGGSVRVAEAGDLARFIHVEQEVDVALCVAADILGFVRADVREAHLLEQIGHRLGVRRGEFDEFEAVQAHRIFGLGLGWGHAIHSNWFHM